MTDTSTAGHPGSPEGNRGPFIIAMMMMAGLLFLATASVLYYRWATTVEPNCVLIVDTTPALRGAEITVDGMMLPTPHKVTVGDADRYSMAFYLDPGTYDVKVSLKDQVLFTTSVVMNRATQGTLDFTRIMPTTQP